MKKFFSALIVCVVISGCLSSPSEDAWPQFNGTEWPGSPAPDFILINQHGENVSLSDFENKIVVIAFTFSTCPDICPMIEYNMNLAKDALGDSYGKDVVFISISIDPLIDTPERMKEYWYDGLGYDWDHLTHTDNETIENVLKSYSIIVDKTYIQAHVSDQVPINATDNMYEDLWIVLEHWNMFSENGQRHVKTPSAINHIENILSQHTTIFQNLYNLDSENNSLIINNGSQTQLIKINSDELNENITGWNLTLQTLNSENISYTLNDNNRALSGINGEDINDWELMIWNNTNKLWENSELGINSDNLNDLYDSGIKNIAILKNETRNITDLPKQIRDEDLCGFEYHHEDNHYEEIIDEVYLWCEYQNNDTVFLEKVSIHITNYFESLNESTSEEVTPEYALGHSTVTLILDKEHNRRVAWTGYNWDHLLFVKDIQLLIDE